MCGRFFTLIYVNCFTTYYMRLCIIYYIRLYRPLSGLVGVSYTLGTIPLSDLVGVHSGVYIRLYVRYIVKHRRSVWRFIAGYSAGIMAINVWSISHYIVVDIWRLYHTLLYRSYKRVVVVLYRVGRLGIACMLSPCYALIWRLYAVVWRVYGGV